MDKLTSYLKHFQNNTQEKLFLISIDDPLNNNNNNFNRNLLITVLI